MAPERSMCQDASMEARAVPSVAVRASVTCLDGVDHAVEAGAVHWMATGRPDRVDWRRLGDRLNGRRQPGREGRRAAASVGRPHRSPETT